MTRPVQPHPLKPLARAPLTLALAQARTAPTLALERSETVERLVEVLGWELVDRQTNVELAVRLGPGGVEQQPGQPQTVWILAGPSGQFRAVLSPSSVAVECSAYSEWQDFQTALGAVFQAVGEVTTPGRVTRFGLRYVNEVIDARLAGEEPERMTEVLAEELVAVAAALERPVIASLSELRVKEPVGQLTIRHGLTAPGRYLLDFDCSEDAAAPGSPFDAKGLMEAAETFHARIEAVFAWALAPDYLASLTAPAEEQSR
jgi:uncharacterized protein (TIGR04255 family)